MNAISRKFESHGVIPARAGAGFKTAHADAILEDAYRVGFLEVHAENYMGEGGHPHRILTRMRADFPLSIHGVGMSVGAPGGLDPAHLARLKRVVERYEPGLVSEHLAWSTHESAYYNDLLPLPYTEETLALVAAHVDEVQSAIGRTILLENPSTYVAFAESAIPETEFLDEIARRSGCRLLLDVNNVHVSAINNGFDAIDYLKAYPLERVGEIHLAGHAEDSDDNGAPLLIDAHDRPVADAVWALYEFVLKQAGPLPTLIEWDNDVPDWPVLKREAKIADAMIADHAGRSLLGARHG
ncbi:DUF692 domain-containing protein [Martelella mediterranea]|uniref:UPF0276 protein Mame_00991 n=1 Tax=Martelella mediterranea DSM 17316 TaxID=1122214 RepID=A0A1U9YY36_9HYPH|nr:DUF692 domain-containing protein [Martelella mediterranea]AQZ50363.1 hypothetical protein Mame_00991 [Martelella mediterranea DSM 17316]